MLVSSGFTIALRPSKDYQRIIALIYLCTVFTILASALPLVIKITLVLFLIIYMMILIRRKGPSPQYSSLSFQSSQWILHETNGQRMQFETAAIRFSGGFFIVLMLENQGRIKKLLIFNDQLSGEQMRTLRLESLKKNKPRI